MATAGARRRVGSVYLHISILKNVDPQTTDTQKRPTPTFDVNFFFQNAPEGTNKYSTANVNWPTIDSFKSGQVLEMDIVMNAYHWVRILSRRTESGILLFIFPACISARASPQRLLYASWLPPEKASYVVWKRRSQWCSGVPWGGVIVCNLVPTRNTRVQLAVTGILDNSSVFFSSLHKIVYHTPLCTYL